MITLATIIVTKYPNGSESKLPAALGLVAVACIVSGLVSGLAITQLGITPLVATLGVNALLTGVVLQITSGAATASATPALAHFALAKTAGVPNTVIIAIVAVACGVRGDAHDRARAAVRRGRDEPRGGARRRYPRAQLPGRHVHRRQPLVRGCAGC